MNRAIGFILTMVASGYAFAGTIIFLDNSVSNDTYIPSNKERQIKSVFDMGLADIKAKFPKCGLDGKVMVGRSDPLNILKQKSEIAKSHKSNQTILVGMIHSSEALLAAKAFADTEFVGLSSGATADNLGEVNSRFFTLANNMSRFAEVMSNFIETELKAKSVVAIFPGGSFYSRQFASILEAKLSGKAKYRKIEVDVSNAKSKLSELKSDLQSADLLFTPGFIQEALPVISALDALEIAAPILGTPNWGRSRSDLELFSKAIGIKNQRIFFPVSWIENESPASAGLESRYQKRFNEVLMGTALYTYDAVMVAGTYLCTRGEVNAAKFRDFISKRDSPGTLNSIREYGAMSGSSLTSRISMTKLNPDRKTFTVQKVYK